MRVIFFVLAVTVAVNAQTPASAVLSGSVVADAGGKGLEGAYVRVTREGMIANGNEKWRYSTVAGADGRFSFNGLPAGTYVVCAAMAPQEDYVDFCAWTLTPPKLTLRPGTTTSGYQIRMEKGVRVEVVVGDPEGLLSGIGDERRRHQLNLRVALDLLPPNRMHFSRSDRKQAEYFLTVPKRSALRLLASAGEADLSKPGEPPGQAKKLIDEALDLPPGQAKKAVEYRYHPKKK